MELRTLAISFKSYDEGRLTYKIAPGVVNLSPSALRDVGVYSEDSGALLGCFEDGTARLNETRRGVELLLNLDKNNADHRAMIELAGKSDFGIRVDYDDDATESRRVGPYLIYTKLNIAAIVLTSNKPDTTDLHFTLDAESARLSRKVERIVFA